MEKLTRHQVLKLIEATGQASGYDLSGLDLRGFDMRYALLSSTELTRAKQDESGKKS